MNNVIDFTAVLNARRAAAETAARPAISPALAEKPMPAYCDPSNERRGTKYDATRKLPLTEVAKRIRADIKALGLGKGFTISVRVRNGHAIDVEVTGLPADFTVLSEKAASWRKQFGERKDYPFAWIEARSAELDELLGKLKAIHGAYNRNNSDSMSDYFDVRYYGSAEIDSRLRMDREKAEIATNPGTYWAADMANY